VLEIQTFVTAAAAADTAAATDVPVAACASIHSVCSAGTLSHHPAIAALRDGRRRAIKSHRDQPRASRHHFGLLQEPGHHVLVLCAAQAARGVHQSAATRAEKPEAVEKQTPLQRRQLGQA
jgi:hypothetical protein